MTTRSKAIETRYKGYRFRSRLEARWAVFMDSLGIRWEYEREGFDLGGVGYLPDFWLPELRMWVEVKAEKPSFNGEEWKKADLLVDYQGWPVCIFFGVPELDHGGIGIRDDSSDSGGGRGYDDPICWVRCRSCGQFTVTLGDDRHDVVDKDWGIWRESACCNHEQNWEYFNILLKEAVESARGARFEFGESGPPR